jgi:hypothetical protein
MKERKEGRKVEGNYNRTDKRWKRNAGERREIRVM